MGTILKPVIPTVLSFPKSVTLWCQPKQVNREDWSLTDRQQRILWWDQNTMQESAALLFGAGGLGSNQARILVQMGVGALDIIDCDLVEDSNRNRQLFFAKDVGKPKAQQLLDNLAPFAVFKTRLRGSRP